MPRRRITSTRSRLKTDEHLSTIEVRGLGTKIIEDFDYWTGEHIKAAIMQSPSADVFGLQMDIDMVNADIEWMQDVCKRLREASDLAMAVARQHELIRHMREDHDGLKEAEIEQRIAKADQLASGKLRELEKALAEALR
jgi:uncharacterized protein YqfA (UPF0365 family)